MDKQKQNDKTKKRGTLGWIMEFAGSKKSSYQNTVVKTKALNDTAVEYIGGIEV